MSFLPWNQIETVLLDMDGTLLDLMYYINRAMEHGLVNMYLDQMKKINKVGELSNEICCKRYRIISERN